METKHCKIALAIFFFLFMAYILTLIILGKNNNNNNAIDFGAVRIDIATRNYSGLL